MLEPFENGRLEDAGSFIARTGPNKGWRVAALASQKGTIPMKKWFRSFAAQFKASTSREKRHFLDQDLDDLGQDEDEYSESLPGLDYLSLMQSALNKEVDPYNHLLTQLERAVRDPDFFYGDDLPY